MGDRWSFRISSPSYYASDTEPGVVNTRRQLILSGKVAEEPRELSSLVDPMEITSALLKRSGPWSIVYHRPDLNRIFVARDVFGRLSLVFAPVNDDIIISDVVCSTSHLDWNEVPYAQVCSIDLRSRSAICNTYLSAYPENILEPWKNMFRSFTLQCTPIKNDLLKISRSTLYPEHTVLEDFLERLVLAVQTMISQDAKSIAVAYSGGVDSMLVAIALHKAYQSDRTIDLVNVAFLRGSEHRSIATDRQRAISGLRYLRSKFADRKWRLILVDVTREDLERNRSEYIARAAVPAVSVLDESLACVLWYGLRGIGKDFDSGEEIKSDAVIYFVGSGADELFGGYARHRTRFNECGSVDSVVEECEAELQRLGCRNGGRDARVAAMLKKELRAPFLDDSFVAWANTLPMQMKCDLTLPRGVGEKLIVRQVLAHLGAPHNAPKQAMQFGSGYVKLQEDKTLKGNDVSRHLATTESLAHPRESQ
ncbi:hypothetical protein KIN20_033361 [Parelaphostrongylus tenuis]|uniref:Asparagine synthetase domain-containing protein n=1 Tax=Parelaphostrongylus tenuis TaxID=148309 RepID=A0AAD5R7X7_PARTN|nr:hypothetical protein KIN20_033361 [Parelaphostrongylus tenuis]